MLDNVAFSPTGKSEHLSNPRIVEICDLVTATLSTVRGGDCLHPPVTLTATRICLPGGGRYFLVKTAARDLSLLATATTVRRRRKLMRFRSMVIRRFHVGQNWRKQRNPDPLQARRMYASNRCRAT